MKETEPKIEFYAGYTFYNSVCEQETPDKILTDSQLYIQSYERLDNGELVRIGGAEESGNPYGFNERAVYVLDKKELYKDYPDSYCEEWFRCVRCFCMDHYEYQPYRDMYREFLKDKQKHFEDFKERFELVPQEGKSYDFLTLEAKICGKPLESAWEEHIKKLEDIAARTEWATDDAFKKAQIVEEQTRMPYSLFALQDIINILNNEFFPTLNDDWKLSIFEKMDYLRQMMPRLKDAIMYRDCIRRKSREGFRKQLRVFIKSELTQLNITANSSVVPVPRVFTDAEVNFREKHLLAVAGIPQDFRSPAEQLLYKLPPDQQQAEIDKYWKEFLEKARECMDGDDVTLFIAVLGLARNAQRTFEKNRQNINIHKTGTMMDTDRIDWFRSDADVVLKEMGLNTEGSAGAKYREKFREKASRLSDFSFPMKISVGNSIIDKKFRLFSFSSNYIYAKAEETEDGAKKNTKGRKKPELWDFKSLADMLFPLNIPRGSSYENISLRPAQWLNKTKARREAGILSGDAFWLQAVAVDKLSTFEYHPEKTEVSFTEPINKLMLAKDEHKQVRESRLQTLSEALAQASPDFKLTWTSKDFTVTIPKPKVMGKADAALPQGMIEMVKKETRKEVNKALKEKRKRKNNK